MNSLERRYADEILDKRKLVGEIRQWWFEEFAFRIGHDCRVTFDFMCWMADGSIEFHECKGRMREDALVKLKVAANRYPFKFYLIKLAKVKEGGGWIIKRVPK